MSEVPQYPGGRSTPAQADDQSELAPRSRRAIVVGTALVVLLVVLVIVLHLTGVLGPGEH